MHCRGLSGLIETLSKDALRPDEELIVSWKHTHSDNFPCKLLDFHSPFPADLWRRAFPTPKWTFWGDATVLADYALTTTIGPYHWTGQNN